ncbi:hypothetical protein GW17_00059101 [Ensete ventricosum]|nr:hypothetical protein GW17_00059101 [Ensete ventricosum]
MGVPGLTLYHLKSHLQVFLRDEVGHLPTFCTWVFRFLRHGFVVVADAKVTHQWTSEEDTATQDEADEAPPPQCDLSSIGIEAVRTELSELVSAMDTECLTCSISHGDSSAESCLTCGDVMEPKEGNSLKQDHSSSALHPTQESDEFSPKTTKRMQNEVHDDLCSVKRSCRQKEDRSSFTIQEELDLNV